MSRKALEIFQDRIFEGAVDPPQPVTPARTLRFSKSVQSLSAPTSTHRGCKTTPRIAGVAHLLQSADGQKQTYSLGTAKAGGRKLPPADKALRHHKTINDLRSTKRISMDPELFTKPCPMPEKPKPRHRTLDGGSSTKPLASRTNQATTSPCTPSATYPPVTAVHLDSNTDGASDGHDAHIPMISQHSKEPLCEAAPSMKPDQRPNVEPLSSDDEMAKARRACSWELRNLSDGLSCPNDFMNPIIRSDAWTPTCGRTPVERIDVTTSWRDLSSADTKELFQIHGIFRDAVKTILANDVQDMFTVVKQNYNRKEGRFAFLDGFRIAIEDRWAVVDREQLIQVMITRAHDYFSQTQYQPNRSALMQLYLSSTECFLDWTRFERPTNPPGSGVALRTFRDQLSPFESPIAIVGSFCDHVEFPSLNYTPLEDQELIIIPQYRRDGIFVHTPYPEDVHYTMGNPISWLAWDGYIKGFRGRVPTYSAFSGCHDFGTDSESGHKITHVLEIIILAKFTKYCPTGSAHFERLVRTQLTLRVLPKLPSSDKNSVYGIEHSQDSMSARNGRLGSVEPFDVPAKCPSGRINTLDGNLPIEQADTSVWENQNRYALETLSLPKNVSGFPRLPIGVQSVHGSINSALPNVLGFTAFPAQSCAQPASTQMYDLAFSTQSSVCPSDETILGCEGNAKFACYEKTRPRPSKRPNRTYVFHPDRKPAKKKDAERKRLRDESGLLAPTGDDVHSPSTLRSRSDPGSEKEERCQRQSQLSTEFELHNERDAESSSRTQVSARKVSGTHDVKIVPRLIRVWNMQQKNMFVSEGNRDSGEDGLHGSAIVIHARTPTFIRAKASIQQDGKIGDESKAVPVSHAQAQAYHPTKDIVPLRPSTLLLGTVPTVKDTLTSIQPQDFSPSGSPPNMSIHSPRTEHTIKPQEQSALTGMRPGGTISFRDIMAHRTVQSGLFLGSSLLDSDSIDNTERGPHSKDREIDNMQSLGTSGPLTFSELRRTVASQKSALKCRQLRNTKDLLELWQHGQVLSQRQDEDIKSPSDMCTSSISSDGTVIEDHNAVMNHVNIEEHSCIHVNPTCTMPQSPGMSAAEWRQSLINSTDSQTGQIQNRQKQETETERLGLEEEIALQAAIETSREEELQRKMATEGFEPWFDDIFDVDSDD